MSPADEEWPHDPLLRVLRAISVVAFLILLAVLLTRGERDITIIGFLIGAILIQLSYDALVGVPGVMTRHSPEPRPPDASPVSDPQAKRAP